MQGLISHPINQPPVHLYIETYLSLDQTREENTLKSKVLAAILISAERLRERQYKDYSADRTLLSCKLATRRVGVSCNHRNMERYISGISGHMAMSIKTH